MANKWDEMRAAYQEAKEQIRATDCILNGMIEMVSDRLRDVSANTFANREALSKMKRTLKDFNLQTQRWMR
jgi:hypothetical protein